MEKKLLHRKFPTNNTPLKGRVYIFLGLTAKTVINTRIHTIWEKYVTKFTHMSIFISDNPYMLS